MHDHTEPVVRQATVADLDAVVPAYGSAILDEAVACWMLPEEQRRHRLAETAGFAAYVRGLLEAGVLIVGEAGRIAGCSVWLYVDGAADEPENEADDEASEALLREMYGEYVDRVRQVGELSGQRRPAGQAYLLLQQMAVVPAFRGRGIGGAMLRHGLGLAQDHGVPAYLEASTPRNRALYARHGFVDAGDPIELPADGPRLQPMFRMPD